MIDFLDRFQAESEPCLNFGELEYINNGHKQFFDKIFVDSTICYECSEQCTIPKTKEYYCPQGEINIADFPTSNFERDKFSLSKFLQIVAQSNNINFVFNGKDRQTFCFGNKSIDGTEYKFYYMLNLANKNQLTDIAIQRIKALKQQSSRLVVLTPDNLIQDNKVEILLKEISCMVVNLENCLNNDLLISGCLSVSESDIEHIKNTYDLAILSSKEIYIKGQKIEYPNQPFLLLDYLAKHSNIAISRDNCIAGAWGDDYVMGDKTLSDNISFVRKGLKDNGLSEKDFITARNKTVKLNVQQDKIYIK